MSKKGTPICLSQKSSPRNFLSLKVQVWIYHWNPESYSKFTSAEQKSESDPNINWFLESLCLAIKKRLLDAHSAVFRQNTRRLVRKHTWMVFPSIFRTVEQGVSSVVHVRHRKTEHCKIKSLTIPDSTSQHRNGLQELACCYILV